MKFCTLLVNEFVQLYNVTGSEEKLFFVFLYLFGIVLLVLKLPWYQSLSTLSLWLFNPGTLATLFCFGDLPMSQIGRWLVILFLLQGRQALNDHLGASMFSQQRRYGFSRPSNQVTIHCTIDGLGALYHKVAVIWNEDQTYKQSRQSFWYSISRDFTKNSDAQLLHLFPKSASTLHGRLRGRLDRSSLGIAIVQRETGQISVRQPAEHSCTRRTQIAETFAANTRRETPKQLEQTRYKTYTMVIYQSIPVTKHKSFHYTKTLRSVRSSLIVIVRLPDYVR